MSSINLPAGVPVYKPTDTTAKGSNSLNGSAQETQDNFMKLLMAQIQNQNPLDPAKPSEFTSQLSQLNTVKGIAELNTNFKSFISQLQARDYLEVSQLAGKQVLSPGNQFALTDKPVMLGANLSADAATVRAVITNSNGQQVDEVALGQTSAGAVRLSWDGALKNGDAAPPGMYRVTFQAAGADGKDITTSPLVTGDVVSAGREGDGVKMRLADGRVVSATDVVEWLK